MAVLQLLMNEKLFLRDPQDTELGRNIVQESIAMIDKLGFEKFTFKKLAANIDSTEASVYRYFENKHKVLLYLISWYWNWLDYKIDYGTQNISEPAKKLEIALQIISEKKVHDPFFPQIDEQALYRIVIVESDKTYLTKQVDSDNEEGLFTGFKSLCNKVADYISDCNPKYQFSNSLSSTVLQAAHHQLFYAQHLPTLTNLPNDQTMNDLSGVFLKEMVFKTISA